MSEQNRNDKMNKNGNMSKQNRNKKIEFLNKLNEV